VAAMAEAGVTVTMHKNDAQDGLLRFHRALLIWF
jgi:hypothetical protein